MSSDEERLQVDVVTPEEPILSEEATEVVLPGELGEMDVFPGHVPVITSLSLGSMTIHENGLTKKLCVEGGFAEILGDHISILAERCEFAEDIDTERAERALEEAEQKLEELETRISEESRDAVSDERLEEVQREIDRQRVRLEISTSH